MIIILVRDHSLLKSTSMTYLGHLPFGIEMGKTALFPFHNRFPCNALSHDNFFRPNKSSIKFGFQKVVFGNIFVGFWANGVQRVEGYGKEHAMRKKTKGQVFAAVDDNDLGVDGADDALQTTDKKNKEVLSMQQGLVQQVQFFFKILLTLFMLKQITSWMILDIFCPKLYPVSW